ncbi:FUSC family protein [Arthrobacter roseus]|uniref:FUSC family protein n=1 Tax=Arthrobacter roseus TaxID=136274 RepID=UPI0019631A44|nr:uncharacterized membrane protein YgaE (UPF0421/DUF939 family) [Arthrobacter roseus]
MDKRRIPLRQALTTTARAAGPASTWRRLSDALPVVAQCGIAAGVAWWLASTLLGHTFPVFAATAAIICLAGGKGERARQAVDLLAGVVAGVAVGELILLVDPGGPLLQAVAAVVLGMGAAAAIDSRRLAYIQGAASALFVLVLPPLQSPGSRILDAAIGGVLGLLGSQVFFTPDPVALVSESVQRVLSSVRAALTKTADALEDDDEQTALDAVVLAREARSQLAELSEIRVIAHRIRRRTVRGLRRAALLQKLDERLDHLDALVAATLLISHRIAERDAQPSSGDYACFLRAAADDVESTARVFTNRTRGVYMQEQLTAAVPESLPRADSVLAGSVLQSLAALHPETTTSPGP